jgi:Tfp pilus assembly protein PilX
MRNRGIALYLVLAVLLLVIILTSSILNIMSSQNRLAGHTVRRIQAYYAGQAGMNYALEQLRLNNASWVVDSVTTRIMHMCQSNTGVSPCNPPNITESSLPPGIGYVRIQVGPLNAATGLTPINSTVNYTNDWNS